MEENNHCIYRHIKPCGEVFYIGIGKDLKRAHNKQSRTNFWKRVVSKYGYEVHILKQNLTKEEACELEKISEGQLGDKNHRWGLKGELNSQYKVPRPKEVVEKMKNATRKRGKENANYGRRHTAESKIKISENANKPCNCEHSFSKEVINLQTGIIHCSGKEAADTYGFKRSTLKSMLNGTNKNWTDLRYLENI